MRYRLPLQVYEQATTFDPKKGVPAPTLIESKKRVVKGRNPDDVLAKARELLESEGREIRSISLGPSGVTAVVFDVPRSRRHAITESRKLKGY